MDDLGCLGSEASLADCRRRAGATECEHREDAGVVCRAPEGWSNNESDNCGGNSTQGDVRLVTASGGLNQGYGRVDVCHEGQWGSVCDDGFDEAAAGVVCASFGYPRRQAQVMRLGEGQEGRGPIWLDQVSCRGTEPALAHCGHRPWGTHDCRHSEDIGVDCRRSGGGEGGQEVTVSRCALYPTVLVEEQGIPIGCPRGRRCVPDRLFCATLSACPDPLGWCTPLWTLPAFEDVPLISPS